MSESVMELAAAAAALAAAERTGLLAAVVERPGPAAELAERLALDPAATERVLEVLRARGVIERAGEHYGPTEATAEELNGPLGRRGLAWEIFSHAPSFLKNGSPALEASTTASGRQRVYRDVVTHLARLFEMAAEELAGALAEHFAAPQNILDVGAGSGVWGLAQLERHSAARLVALDLPDVCERVTERATALGVSDRVTLWRGDMHDEVLEPASFDRVVLANVVHLEPAERAASLIGRAVTALRPGGQLVIVDMMAVDGPALDRHHAAYALFLALRIEGAHPHAEPRLRHWVSQAGAESGPRIDLVKGPPGLSALVACV